MCFPSREKVEKLRSRFTKDDAGQVHVNWGGGSSLALNPEIDDYYLY